MRATIVAAMLLALGACSDVNLGPTSGDRPILPPEPVSSYWVGSQSCAVGQVRVEVEFFGELLDPAQLYPMEARVTITVDGELQPDQLPHRFRSGGSDIRLGGRPEGDLFEVYTGLGADCEWIAVQRLR